MLTLVLGGIAVLQQYVVARFIPRAKENVFPMTLFGFDESVMVCRWRP